MLAPENAIFEKKIFCTMTDNDGQESHLSFDSQLTGVHGANLYLDKLYIITGNRTASASEAVINGLDPFMEVIIVGKRTEGKNVGSRMYSDPGFEWELHPIVVKISNSQGFSDYADGFLPTPDYECDEANAGELTELGEPEEYILGLLLDHIVYGTPFKRKAVAALCTPNDLEPLYNSLDRKKTNSVILPSNNR
jgi:hypothetical protein